MRRSIRRTKKAKLRASQAIVSSSAPQAPWRSKGGQPLDSLFMILILQSKLIHFLIDVRLCTFFFEKHKYHCLGNLIFLIPSSSSFRSNHILSSTLYLTLLPSHLNFLRILFVRSAHPHTPTDSFPTSPPSCPKPR